MAKIEIQGLDRLRGALKSLPKDLQPRILQDIARKPAMRASAIARTLQPIGDTGATGRTIGIRKIRSPRQTFVEVGYRGRSLGHIYMSGPTITRNKRGTIKGFPFLFKRTGEQVRASGRMSLKADLSKVIGRSLRRRGYRPRI